MEVSTKWRELNDHHRKVSPFFAAIGWNLNKFCQDYIQGKDENGDPAQGPVPTAATDGVSLVVNPGLVEAFSLDQGDVALCHEIMHFALKHPLRRMDFMRWMVNHGMEECSSCCNYAEDAYINCELKGMGKVFPEGFVDEDRAKGLDVHQIMLQFVYKEQHPKHQKQKSGGGDSGSGKPGQGPPQEGCCRPAPHGLTDKQVQELEKAVDRAVEAAARAAKARGELPASMQRFVDELTAPPRVQPAEILAQYFDKRSPIDYSYQKLSRSGRIAGTISPSLSKRTLGPVAIFVDTSGSMSDDQFQHAHRIVQDCWSQCCPTELHVLFIDAEVNRADVFQPGDTITFQPGGGGGTSFKPGFEYLKKNGIEVSCVLYFTDLYGDWRDMEDPGVDTVFIATGTEVSCGSYVNPNWGTVIYIGDQTK